jgi:hypothetical protein
VYRDICRRFVSSRTLQDHPCHSKWATTSGKHVMWFLQAAVQMLAALSQETSQPAHGAARLSAPLLRHALQSHRLMLVPAAGPGLSSTDVDGAQDGPSLGGGRSAGGGGQGAAQLLLTDVPHIMSGRHPDAGCRDLQTLPYSTEAICGVWIKVRPRHSSRDSVPPFLPWASSIPRVTDL